MCNQINVKFHFVILCYHIITIKKYDDCKKRFKLKHFSKYFQLFVNFLLEIFSFRSLFFFVFLTLNKYRLHMSIMVVESI